MVHGAAAGRWGLDLVRPHLQDRFTVWALDRRGRGDSGDGHDSYSSEDEFEDVAAVLREAGPGALLFGHSYGGLVAAGGRRARRGPAALVLYEGPMGGVWVDEAWIARFEAHLEAGDPEPALRGSSADVGGYTDGEIDAMAARPPGRPASPPHRPSRASFAPSATYRFGRPAAGRAGRPGAAAGRARRAPTGRTAPPPPTPRRSPTPRRARSRARATARPRARPSWSRPSCATSCPPRAARPGTCSFWRETRQGERWGRGSTAARGSELSL